METKKFLKCKLTEIKMIDMNDKFFMFEGYASTFGNEDLGGDIVVKGAFSSCIAEMTARATPIKDTDFKKLMPVLWQHDWSEPIGSFVEMREDDKGLFVKGILPKSDTFVRGRVIPQMEASSISDMSIGYSVQKESFDGNTRMIEKAKLFETSLVTIPMNDEAVVTAFKSAQFHDLPIAPLDTEWDHDAAQKRHTEKGVDSQAYLCIIDNGVDREEYALPIADFVDGKLCVIPKAVFYAAHVVANTDQLSHIGDEQMDGIKSNINKYYKAMGKESPFKDTKAFRVDDMEVFSERELETMLKSGVCFSQKMAKTILSVLNGVSQRDVDEKSQRDADVLTELNKLLTTFKKG